MELLELTNKTKEIFGIDDVGKLGDALKANLNNFDVYDQFVALVDDLDKDWLQMIYQYYQADRKEKKQDFTPKCLAEFLSMLVGEAEICVDMCAGSGALTIQRWTHNRDQKFRLIEIDDAVIPYLLFNLAIRNIQAEVLVGSALDNDFREVYDVVKGEKYASVSLQPTV